MKIKTVVFWFSQAIKPCTNSILIIILLSLINPINSVPCFLTSQFPLILFFNSQGLTLIMTSKFVTILLLATFTCSIAYSGATRELPKPDEQQFFNLELVAAKDESRNSTNGTLANCWNAIAEIKSCGNEITAYFNNGTIDIGVPCCQAIKMITLHCWPSMLSVLGITPDQCNILVGYCDASAAAAPAPSSSMPVINKIIIH